MSWQHDVEDFSLKPRFPLSTGNTFMRECGAVYLHRVNLSVAMNEGSACFFQQL
jgi:hypothetical protein